MKPLDVFNKNWSKLSSSKIKDYRVEENLVLGNGKVADIAIYCFEVCVAYGNYYDTLNYLENDDSSSYFHGDHGFMGCGTTSQFWFYFDNEQIIINDHSHFRPFDEIMRDYKEFLNRITKESN